MPLFRIQPTRCCDDGIAYPPQFVSDRRARDVRMEFPGVHPVQDRPDPVLPPAAGEARRDRVRVADNPVWKPGENPVRVPHPRFQEIPTVPHNREIRPRSVGMEQRRSRRPAAREQTADRAPGRQPRKPQPREPHSSDRRPGLLNRLDEIVSGIAHHPCAKLAPIKMT